MKIINKIKNLVGGFNHRISISEEGISEMEDKSEER